IAFSIFDNGLGRAVIHCEERIAFAHELSFFEPYLRQMPFDSRLNGNTRDRCDCPDRADVQRHSAHLGYSNRDRERLCFLVFVLDKICAKPADEDGCYHHNDDYWPKRFATPDWQCTA